jgi:chromosome segregation ATPase
MKRILYLLSFAIAFAVCAQAQTQPKKPAPRVPVQTMKSKLAEAEAQNADLKRQYDELAVLLGNQITDLETRNKNIEAVNKDAETVVAFIADHPTVSFDQAKAASTDLGERNPELGKQFNTMFGDLAKFYAQAVELQKEYQKLSAAHDTLISRYNELLAQANTLLATANANLARQQRINNALAIYSMMPKYQPVQLPPPPVFAPALQINCTSTTMGTTVYTDCH